MISIIISSYNKKNFSTVSKSIACTIGVPYEIIQEWNPGNLSICQAYNSGYKKSQYPILLFLHEDLIFNNQGWGKQLVKTFDEDPKVGLIGIAGASAKTRAPSTWWKNGDDKNYINITQGIYTEDELHLESHLSDIKKTPVVVLDGVFIAMRKTANIYFNENIQGFHNYDLSISIDFAVKGWTILCINFVNLTHFSHGTIDAKWMRSADNFYELYKDKLPMGLEGLSSKDLLHLETNNLMNYIDRSIKFKEKKLGWKYLLKLWLLQPLTKRPYVMLKRLIGFK